MQVMQVEDEAWTDYRNRFAEVYHDSNYSSPLQSYVMKASHKLLENQFGKQRHFERVIEVGAGTGEHLLHVNHTFDEYVLSDMDPKTLDVAKNKINGKYAGKIRYEVQVGSNLEYPDESFDRLIAVHLLEHIPHPHLALKEWRRVLKPGGVMSILIPTDPGFAWRLGRHFGPRKNAIAMGIAYDYVMAREHVNSCVHLISLLRHYFPVSSEAWWPLPIPSVDMNLFFAFHTTISK